MLRESDTPLKLSVLARQSLLHEQEAESLLRQLVSAGRARALVGGGFLHAETIARAAARLRDLVSDFHAANPQRAGIGRDELFAAAGMDGELFSVATQSLLDAKEFEWNAAVFARASWKPRTTNRDEEIVEQVAAAFQRAGWASPSPEEVAASLRVASAPAQKAFRLLHERGVLIRLDDRVSMHREAVEKAKQVVLRLFSRQASFTTMDFRDALGVSRKFAVPLVDYLDRMRYTVRSGNNRTPGVEARKAMPQCAAAKGA
jgi:selenocysteine-specific elongation factor